VEAQHLHIPVSDLWGQLDRVWLGLGIIDRITRIVPTPCHDEAASADRTERPSAMQQQPEVSGQACQLLLSSPHTLPALATAITVFEYGSVMFGDRPLQAELPGAVATASAGSSTGKETNSSAAPTAAADSSQRHSHAGPDVPALPQQGTTRASSSKSSLPQPESTLRAEAPGLCSGGRISGTAGRHSGASLSLLLSGSTSEAARDLLCLFEVAASWDSVVTPCQQELFSALDVHPKAALMAAAYMFGHGGVKACAAQQAIQQMCILLDPACKLLLATAEQHSCATSQSESQPAASLAGSDLNCTLLPPSSPGTVPPTQQQQQQQQQQRDTVGQLLLWLPTVLLQCAAKQPAGSEVFTMTCACAAISSCSALFSWQGIITPQNSSTGSSPHMEQQQQHCWKRLPSSWSHEMLPVVLKLLLQLLEQDHAHPDAAAGSSARTHTPPTQAPAPGSGNSSHASSGSPTGISTNTSSHVLRTHNSQSSGCGGKKGRGSGKAAQLLDSPSQTGSHHPHLPGLQVSNRAPDSELRQSAIFSLNTSLNALMMHVVTDPARPTSGIPARHRDRVRQAQAAPPAGGSAGALSAPGAQPAAQHDTPVGTVIARAPDVTSSAAARQCRGVVPRGFTGSSCELRASC